MSEIVVGEFMGNSRFARVGEADVKESYRVKDLPNGLSQESFAGYLPIEGILPGPGCSSLIGMMFENGPFHINDDMTLRANPYSWTKASNVLYIEQPVETGFSFSPSHYTVQNEHQVSRDLYAALRVWASIFPEYSRNDFFVFGESYAGMYSPSLARTIHEMNLVNRAEHQINLKGLALGNAWVDALTQMASIPNYAYAHGLIDGVTKEWLLDKWSACEDKFQQSKEVLEGQITQCDLLTLTLSAAGEPNEFDVSTFVSYNDLLSTDSGAFHFLNNPAVRHALHVGDRRIWSACSDNITMDGDKPISMVPTLVHLLQVGYKIMAYNGERDMNCNLLGTEAYLDGMVWEHAQRWKAQKRSLWLVEGSASGYVKEVDNLQFLVVLNSGHLVPMNQPKVSLDLMRRFTRGLSFADKELVQPWFVALPSEATTSPAVSTTTTDSKTLQWSPQAHSLFIILCIAGTGVGVLAFYIFFRKQEQRAEYEVIDIHGMSMINL